MKPSEIADGSTAFHFGIGALAGLSGMDPKLVLLVALFADATWEVLSAGSIHAALEPEHGQSKAKEIVNLLSIIAGAHIGKYVKEQGSAASSSSAPAPPAAAPATSVPTITMSGLGAAHHCGRYGIPKPNGRCRYIGPPVFAY